LDRVLKARYSEEGGRLKEGGRHSSHWWRMLCGVLSRVGLDIERWLDDNTGRVMGDGSSTYFWTNN